MKLTKKFSFLKARKWIPVTIPTGAQTPTEHNGNFLSLRTGPEKFLYSETMQEVKLGTENMLKLEMEMKVLSLEIVSGAITNPEIDTFIFIPLTNSCLMFFLIIVEDFVTPGSSDRKS